MVFSMSLPSKLQPHCHEFQDEPDRFEAVKEEEPLGVAQESLGGEKKTTRIQKDGLCKNHINIPTMVDLPSKNGDLT